jgi:chorismate synthase
MSIFNKIFKISTFGESHGDSVGVIIDGCPPNLRLDERDIQPQLSRRKPGQSDINTPRYEDDIPIILSGTENCITLGTPICVIVKNKNIKKEDYSFLKEEYKPRPSHADLTYIYKYGIHASSGGGRSSARETIARVISGSIAEKYMREKYNLEIVAWVSQIGDIKLDNDTIDLNNITRNMVDSNIVRMPDFIKSEKAIEYIRECKENGDSIGGVISCICRNIPVGIGEPIFDKLEALLAHAMLSIPASKGFEIGSGFSCSTMKGSEHNDEFVKKGDKIGTKTNHSGGIQGGISNGENIYFKVAFKPPATISKKQKTVNLNGEETYIEAKGRHDPCIVNRAVPIVESMAALVLIDAILYQKTR